MAVHASAWEGPAAQLDHQNVWEELDREDGSFVFKHLC